MLAKAFQAKPGFPPARWSKRDRRRRGRPARRPQDHRRGARRRAFARRRAAAQGTDSGRAGAAGGGEERVPAGDQGEAESSSVAHDADRAARRHRGVRRGSEQDAETGKIGRTLHLAYLERCSPIVGAISRRRAARSSRFQGRAGSPSEHAAGGRDRVRRALLHPRRGHLRKVVDRAPRAVLPRRMLAATLLRQGRVDRASELSSRCSTSPRSTPRHSRWPERSSSLTATSCRRTTTSRNPPRSTRRNGDAHPPCTGTPRGRRGRSGAEGSGTVAASDTSRYQAD